jgi:hypothetical protein
MYSDDDSEQRKEPEEYKGVHQNRSAASLEVAEVYSDSCRETETRAPATATRTKPPRPATGPQSAIVIKL